MPSSEIIQENEPLIKKATEKVPTEYKLCDLPLWFNEKGYLMKVTNLNLERKELFIDANDEQGRLLGKLMIIKNFGQDETGWWLEWVVCPWDIYNDKRCEILGMIILTDLEIKRAFGLIKNARIGEFGHYLVETYGGDSADQGKYIRYKNYLNIPHPGTGLDGDPNISIFLTDEIKKAVRKLLNT